MNWTVALVTTGVLGACFGLIALTGHVEHRRTQPTRGRHAPGRAARTFRGDFDRYGEDGRGGRSVVVDPLTETELLAARAGHGAESFAVDPEQFRMTHDDEVSALWRANFDWYGQRVNERAHALAADAERLGSEALDDFDREMAEYDEKIRLMIERFVHGEPEVVLAVVNTAAESSGTVFTWSTGGYPTVLSVPPAPVRELYAARIAQDPAAAQREAPAERFYAAAGFVN